MENERNSLATFTRSGGRLFYRNLSGGRRLAVAYRRTGDEVQYGATIWRPGVEEVVVQSPNGVRRTVRRTAVFRKRESAMYAIERLEAAPVVIKDTSSNCHELHELIRNALLNHGCHS